MERRCREVWRRSGGGRWLVAVSGGADSTALLLAAREAGIPAEAAHCNFNLRGAESLRDRDFVVDLCRELNIPLNLEEFDTLAEKRPEESIEMTCRRLRYDFFRSLLKEKGFSHIAVAHNADDNIETFFINALRGSSARGLKAMEEVAGDIVRPLLPFSREEILAYLADRNQPFITDSTNLESAYRRNFLRNEIFPLLESRWEGFRHAITKTISLQARDNRIVEHYVAKALENAGDCLTRETLQTFPDPETLIFRFIQPHGGTTVIAAEMAAAIQNEKNGKSGQIWHLADAVARLGRDGLQIETPQPEAPAPKYKWKKIKADVITLDGIKWLPLTLLFLPCGEENFEWRPATKEMKIKPLGMTGSQSVWKVLKDAGLSPAQRANFQVLVSKADGQPVWLPGIKRSRLYLIDGTESFVYCLHI